jgi:hypothetical protein
VAAPNVGNELSLNLGRDAVKGKDRSATSKAGTAHPRRQSEVTSGGAFTIRLIHQTTSNDQVERPCGTAIFEALYRSRPLQPIVRRLAHLRVTDARVLHPVTGAGTTDG